MGEIFIMGKNIPPEVVLVCSIALTLCVIILLMVASRFNKKLKCVNIELEQLRKVKNEIECQLLEERETRISMQKGRLAIQQDILKNPRKYFFVKDTIYGSKQEVNLLGYLDKLVYKKSTPTTKYIIFPQVSLHAYINPLSALSGIEKNAALELLGGKNTDFLICRTVFGTTPQVSEILKPIVAIEINGDQHDTNYITIRNDGIKKALFDGLGIPLVSHKLGSGEYIQDEVAPYLK